MRIRENYINPLSLKHSQPRAAKLPTRQEKQADPAETLQNKRQQLQNQLILLKATGTDGAAASEESQKELEAALEEVSAELRTAKASPTPQEAPPEASRFDRYEKDKQEPEAFGSYSLEKDGQSSYRILFSPYED